MKEKIRNLFGGSTAEAKKELEGDGDAALDMLGILMTGRGLSVRPYQLGFALVMDDFLARDVGGAEYNDGAIQKGLRDGKPVSNSPQSESTFSLEIQESSAGVHVDEETKDLVYQCPITLKTERCNGRITFVDIAQHHTWPEGMQDDLKIAMMQHDRNTLLKQVESKLNVNVAPRDITALALVQLRDHAACSEGKERSRTNTLIKMAENGSAEIKFGLRDRDGRVGILVRGKQKGFFKHE